MSEQDSQVSRVSFVPSPDRWPLLLHTAINMQSQQLSGILERKLRHAVIPRVPIDFDERYERRIPDSFQPSPEPVAGNLRTLRECLSDDERETHQRLVRESAEGVVTFLNQPIDFGTSRNLDWDHPKLDEYPLLWRLKLQSFEFLKWLTLGFDGPTDAPEADAQIRSWLLSWSEANPIGEEHYLRRSWIPHSVSLRILNLCRYCAWCEHAGVDLPVELYRLLFKNALFLENHVEYDIGGNHLIENAVALTIAGVFFEDHDTTWVERGTSILENAAVEQFLEDGGHFERSPMYHVMVLTRYLTVVHLLERAEIKPPARIRHTAESGVGFLRAIRPPDDRIPLLNDSVYGEEVELPSCLRYASRIGIEADDPNQPHILDASGYYWLGRGKTRMLIDGGPVGPSHLPAHSHNDQLAFLLWIDGRPVITDTGTYEYAPTERRQYSRSVRAHNTVQVNDTEPIDIGGQYLMGRRSKPSVRLIKGERETTFQGTFHKRSISGTAYTHDRRIVARDDAWFVRDKVDSNDPFTSRLHFHPDVSIRKTDNGSCAINVDSTSERLSVTPRRTGAMTLTTSEYYPAFGVSVERETLTFEADDTGQCEFILSVSPQDRSEMDTERSLMEPL